MNPATSPHPENSSESVPKKPEYSLVWAYKVVEDLYRAHPRATENVARILGIGPRMLALFLAKRDPMWNAIRDIIKRLENLEVRTGKYLTDVQLIDWVHHGLHRVLNPECLQRLDKRFESLKLEEQGSRQGPPIVTPVYDGGPHFECTPYGVQYLLFGVNAHDRLPEKPGEAQSQGPQDEQDPGKSGGGKL